MNIYDALKKDHDEVIAMLDRLIATGEKDDSHFDIVDQIRDELIPHARAEEAVFYNSLRALNGKEEVRHGYKEHLEAESLLRSLQIRDSLNANWKKTAEKLRETLQHHINEEEGKIFNLAKRLLSEQEATEIGNAFEKLKPKYREEGFMGTTAEMIKNMMPARLKKLPLDPSQHQQM